VTHAELDAPIPEVCRKIGIAGRLSAFGECRVESSNLLFEGLPRLPSLAGRVAEKRSAFQCQRAAAAVMTLIQSAKLNGHHPHAYLKDVLTRLPTQMNNAIDELLLHNWKQAITNKV